MFRVGQKVVCVDAHSPPIHVASGDSIDIRAGMILTVADVTVRLRYGILCLQFCELPTANSLGGQRWYQASRFRPVVERKTDISVFTEILRRASSPTAPVEGA